MKKWFLVCVGLILTIGIFGCKSKKQKVYEQQIDVIRKIFIANGLNAEKELKYGIARDLETKQISNLNLSGRNLTVLPPEIGSLTGLEELNLQFNKLQKLPDEIGNLINLKKLNVSTNLLTVLPPTIGNLSSLEELDIAVNKICGLHESIGNLSNLSQFWLYKNNLYDLPFTMIKLTKIIHLAPQDNPFKIFPKVLGMMPHLSSIMLSPGFDTTTIPENVIHVTGGEYYVSH